MFVRHLRIRGFKSLVDVQLDLGALNVFIGANGSGKSNVLEALGVLGAGAFGSVEPETLRYRGVRLGLPKLYKSSFKQLPIRRLITLETGEAETTGAFYRLAVDNPITSPLVRWKIASENLRESEKVKVMTRSPAGCKLHQERGGARRIEIRDDETATRLAVSLRPDLKKAAALIKTLGEYAIYSPNTPVLRDLAQDVARSPLGLAGSGLPECLQRLIDHESGTFGSIDLDDLFELLDWAEDLTVVPREQAGLAPGVTSKRLVARFTDRYMRRGRNTLSAYDASEGALYILFALALVIHPEAPRLLALDNFDQALHPRLAAALTRLVARTLLVDGGRQIMVTTHNPLVLDGLDLANDEIRLFAVERERSGPTRIRRIRLSPELLETSRRERLPLSRLWIMGRLGGIPEGL
jgi:predicted ATPase